MAISTNGTVLARVAGALYNTQMSNATYSEVKTLDPASLTDAFGFVGSCIAQLLMVLQRYESWIIWIVVDAVYTYQYWHGKNYLTAILYFIFTLIAVAGWKRWRSESAAPKA